MTNNSSVCNIKYPLLSIFIFLSLFAFSQNEVDSLDLNYKYKKPLINVIDFDQAFLSIYYPLSTEINLMRKMNSQVFNDLINMSSYDSFICTSPNFYQFYSKGFYFWQNSAPLTLGYSVHLKDVFGWDKLDVFSDVQGGLYNVYKVEGGVFVPTNERAFSWSVGAGVGYKVSKESTIYIKSSVSVDNLKPVGNRNVGGVNVKF